jgi:hypothetical protein
VRESGRGALRLPFDAQPCSFACDAGNSKGFGEWRSAAAHLAGKDDDLVTTAPLLALVPDWSAYVSSEAGEAQNEALRKHECTGRPLGSTRFSCLVHER